MDEHIHEQIITEMKENIQQLLNGKTDTIVLEYVRPDDVIVYLENLTGEDVEYSDMECNGWQFDFWIPLEINDKKYILAGDGIYNNYLTFYLK